jgi:hypothetical protein
MEQSMSINDEELWAAKLPNGDVRSGTLEQLDEAFRSGHLGEDTLVCASGSDSWITIADVLGAAIGASSTALAARPASGPPPSAAIQPAFAGINDSPEHWQVRLPSGEVRSGTHPQLMEAFRAGHLDEDVLVLAAGAREWVRLGTVVTRSEPPAPVVPSGHPLPSVVPQHASAPPPSTATPAQPHGIDEVVQVGLADGHVRTVTRQDQPIVVAQETPVTPSEQAPVAAAPDAFSPLRTEDGQPDSQAAGYGDQSWRVNLNGRQLERAFNAGLLDDDALVLAAGTDDWVRLGDVRRSQSLPRRIPLGTPSGHEAAATHGCNGVDPSRDPSAAGEGSERPSEEAI